MPKELKELFVKSTAKQEKRKGNHWAKLRILKDRKDGLDYFDIVAGEKHEEHAHYAFNLDGSLKFRVPRKKINSMRKVVELEFHGKLSDEKVQFRNTESNIELTFQVRIKKSGEVYVSIFDFEIKWMPLS